MTNSSASQLYHQRHSTLDETKQLRPHPRFRAELFVKKEIV